jgi:hypothetical protein
VVDVRPCRNELLHDAVVPRARRAHQRVQRLKPFHVSVGPSGEQSRQIAAVVLRAVSDEEIDHCDISVLRCDVEGRRAIVCRDSDVRPRLDEASRHVGVPVPRGEEEGRRSVRRAHVQIDFDVIAPVLELDFNQHLHDQTKD